MGSPPEDHHDWFAGVGLFCFVSAFLFMSIITSSAATAVYGQSPSYPIEIERVMLADPSGQPLSDCRSGGGLVMIAVTLKNLSDAVQPAAIVVELQDSSSGITQFVQWQTMSIGSGATPRMAISFNPSSLQPSGQYAARVLVWNEVLTPAPLSNPVQISIRC
jgi:hypothetical protein